MARMDSVVAVGRGKIVQITRHWPKKLSGDTALTGRALAHLTMIVVAIMVIVLSNLELSWGTISAIRPLKRATAKPIVEAVTEESGAPLTLPDELNDTRNGVLVRGAVPRIIIPEQTQAEQSKKEDIQIYVVQSGDTISGIATKFGLAPETIIWSNTAQEKNPDLLSVGQELIILPIDGVYHQVGGGDTIEGIAATYKADPGAIINYPLNKLDPENLIIQPGQWLIVPAGNKPFIPRTVAAYSGPVPEGATVGSGIFGWPASGSITQGYYGYHPGIDIGGWQGAPVIAADSGHVVAAGWDNTGYGNVVVIDHGNGFQTLYAHLHASYTEPGIDVAKGQQIGEMGSTGNATGPHLHFEIRQGTVQRNPYGFLP
jgi:murein DD-endopeptidase MepM/ murein hydrolase activator NlpD